MNTDPILSSPPAFVLLAGMVGLGVYLRQLSETRIKLIEHIEAGDEDFPPGEDHTAQKLKDLRRSWHYLNNIIAPIVIWSTILLALRLATLATFRALYSNEPKWADPAFRWFDAGFTIVVFLLFAALGVLHHRARKREERLRFMLAGWRAGKRSNELAGKQQTS